MNLVKTLWNKKESKQAFGAALILGLIAHAYRLLNFLPNSDAVEYFMGNKTGIAQGDFLYPVFRMLITPFDMPWIEGGLAILCLAIMTVLIADLFEVSGICKISLLAACLVANPAVTSSLAYMKGTECQMLSYLLITAAVWQWSKAERKFRHLIAILLTVAGLGISHASISIALLLILLLGVRNLFRKDNITDLLKQLGGMIAILLLSGLGYHLLLVIVAKLRGRIIEVHYGINDWKNAWGSTWDHVFNYWKFYEDGSIRLLGICGYMLVALLIALLVVRIIQTKIYRTPAKCMLLAALLFLLPIAVYILYFLENDVQYFTYMEYGNAFILILFIILWNDVTDDITKVKVNYGVAIICSLFLGLLSYSGILNSNVNYFYMTLSYEKTYANCLDLLNRMDDCDSFGKGCTVAVLGQYDSLDFLMTEEVPTSGVTPKVFLTNQKQYITFWKNMCGIPFNEATQEQRTAIEKSEEFLQMQSYPAQGCVKEIDGVIVVKLSAE